MLRAIPHGFTVSDAGPGRVIIVAPGGFDQFVAADDPAPDLCLPAPVPPDPARLTAAHGIQFLPPPEP